MARSLSSPSLISLHAARCRERDACAARGVACGRSQATCRVRRDAWRLASDDGVAQWSRTTMCAAIALEELRERGGFREIVSGQRRVVIAPATTAGIGGLTSGVHGRDIGETLRAFVRVEYRPW